MTDPQESFWEIVKYFDFLVSDFGYKTRRMEILRDCVLVSYIGPNNRLIEIGKNWNGDNNASFRMKGFLGRSIINDERPMSIKNYAGFIGSRYFSRFSGLCTTASISLCRCTIQQPGSRLENVSVWSIGIDTTPLL